MSHLRPDGLPIARSEEAMFLAAILDELRAQRPAAPVLPEGMVELSEPAVRRPTSEPTEFTEPGSSKRTRTRPPR